MVTGTNSGCGGELGRSSEQLLSLNADGGLKPHEGAFAQAQWPRERAAMAARMSRCRDAFAIGSLKIGCKLRNVTTCLIGLAYDGVLLSVIRGRGDRGLSTRAAVGGCSSSAEGSSLNFAARIDNHVPLWPALRPTSEKK
jgi:hypothetical protein